MAGMVQTKCPNVSHALFQYLEKKQKKKLNKAIMLKHKHYIAYDMCATEYKNPLIFCMDSV